MGLTVEFISDLDASARKAVVGTLGFEIIDLQDAVKKARTILSDASFHPTVAGYRIIAGADQIIFIEPRGVSEITAPLPIALQLSRWSLRAASV